MPFPILRIGDVLITTIQVELHDSVVDGFQEDILQTISRTDTRGLIIDISALDVVDSYAARVIAETARMVRLMGVEPVLVGIQPVVAATLVRMGFRLEGLHTALNVEDGLAMMPDLLRRRRR
jgi:rsbT antagonist protein RsbS